MFGANITCISAKVQSLLENVILHSKMPPSTEDVLCACNLNLQTRGRAEYLMKFLWNNLMMLNYEDQIDKAFSGSPNEGYERTLTFAFPLSCECLLRDITSLNCVIFLSVLIWFSISVFFLYV